MNNGLAKANRLFLIFGGLLLGAFFAYLGLSHPAPAAAANNNQTINFQGRLLNSQGAAVADGFYNIEFKVYQDGDGQTAGDTTGSPTGTLKWTEDHLNSASHGIKVVNGFLSVQLGSVTAFGSNIDWNQGNLWLSMNIGDTSNCTITTSFASDCNGDGEMLPMQPLTSSPYALNSGELNGLTSNNFVQLAQGVQTDASTSSSIYINKTGASGSILELQKGGVDVMNVSNTGTLLLKPSADSATALQVQNHANGYSVFSVDTSGNAVVLGQASSLTGKLQFATAGGGTLTINPTSSASNFTITLPAETGTVCTTAASGACSVAGSGYVQLAPSSVQADSTNNNSIYLNKTSGTGSIIDLQKSGADVFTVGNNGQILSKAAASSDSVNLFQVQSSGGSSVLNADSVNMRLGVDTTYTAVVPPVQNNTSTSTTGGTLAAGTYRYEITAVDSAGGETAVSNEKSQVTTGTTSTVTLSWNNVTGATGYKVYRTAVNGSTGTETFLVYSPKNSYIDTGSITPGSATPPSAGSAYYSATNSNNDLQLSVGGLGRPTGQVYVSGVVPSTAVGSIVSGGSGSFGGGQVQGKYLYSNSNGKLLIYEVDNPIVMSLVSSTSVSNIRNLAVSGHYVYAMRGSSGISIYDVSNPSSPSLAGSYSANLGTGTNQGILVKGRYVYVMDTSVFPYTLRVIDVYNPASPVQVGSALTGITAGGTINLALNDRYVYVSVTGGASGFMEIFDISNPSAPVRSSTTTTSPYQGVATEGKYAFFKQGNNGIDINSWDVSNPSSPTLLQTLGDSFNNNGGQTRMIIQGRYMYVGGVFNYLPGIEIFDISNPANMVLTGTASITGQLLAVSGRYAYVVDSSSNLVAYDLGGAYIQQLETGGLSTSTLNVTSSATFAQDVSIQGGLQLGQSLQVSGNAGVTGGLNVQGSAVLSGGANQLATPGAPAIAPQGTGGSQRWDYTVTAVNSYGGETLASTAGTTASGNATLSSTNYNHITWSSVSGATSYKIYRVYTTGATSPTSTGLVGSTTTTAFDDVGYTAAGSAPTINTTGQLSVTGSALFQNSANSTSALQVQNAAGASVLAADTTNGQLVLGTSGASGLTGQIKFNYTGQTGSITLAPANPSSTAYTVTLPAETGTICTTAASGACSVAGSGYVQLAPSAVQADSTNNNSIFVNKTSGTGNILELQKSNVDVFTINNSGNVTSTGTVTFGSTAGTLGYSNSNTGSYINPANSVFSVYDGAGQQNIKVWYAGSAFLQLQGPSGPSGTATVLSNPSSTASTPNLAVKSGDQTGTSLSSGSLFLQSGNAGGGTNASSGNVTLDSGSHSGTGTSGSVSIGTTNAPTVTIGSGSGTTNLSNNNYVASGKVLKVGTVSVQNSDQFVSVGNAGFDAQAVTPYGGFGNYSNLLKYSEQLGNGSTWSIGSGLTVTSDATAAPDGQTTAENLNFTTTTSTNYDQQSYNTGSSVANRTFTFSFWAKANTITAGQVLFRTAPTSAQDPTTTNFTLSTSWERYTFTKTFAAGDTDTSPQILIRNNGVTGSYYVWGTQLEEASSAGAYVSTTASPVTSQANGFVFGSAQALFKSDTDSSGAFQIQNAAGTTYLSGDSTNTQLVLGKASSLSGKIAFASAGGGTITLAAGSTASSYSLTLPTSGPSTGQCIQTDSLDNTKLVFGACGASGTFLNKNATDTSSAAGGTGYLYGFTSTGSSTGGVLSLNNSTNTGSTLSATTAGNPAAGKAVIYGENTNASPSGNLLDLQSGSSPTSKFSVDYNGNLSLGGASPVTIQGTASNGTVNLYANGTGSLTLDTTGAGTVSIAGTHATAINIGTSSVTSTITNSSTGISATLTGSATVPSYVVKTTNNNSGAFQVQNSSSQKVFSVDTSAKKAVLGQSNAIDGALLFQNSTSSNAITINSTGTSSNYTLTLPTTSPAGGLCIETSPGNASQLVFASCSNNNASIQEVAEWDANNTNTFTVSPTTAGDEMVLTTQIPTNGVTVTGVSGGGVTTWNPVVTSPNNATVHRVEMWVGTVTSTGSSSITVTYSSAPGAEEIAATEFTAAGVNANTSWGIESSGAQLNSTSSTTVTYPNLTAVSGSELYVGYAQVQNPPATSGSSTGFNYIQTSTQHNMIAYNPSLTANTAYQPTANQNSAGQSNTIAAVLTAFVTSSSINNTTSLQKANFYVQAASGGTVAGVLQAASSTPGDILDLKNSGGTNVVTVSSAGNVLVKPAASATAFQVQNGSSYSVMAVDTSGNSVVLGDATHLSGSITFKDSGDSNSIAITAPTTVAASYSLALPNNTPTAGLCLATSPSNANQLIFASCATQVSAASISYVNKWDNHGTSVTTISDSPSNLGDLLVFYSHTANAVNVNSISGGGVTTWYKVTAYQGGGTPGNIEMWRGVVTATGSGTVTVTYSGTAGTNEIVAEEFTMGSANGTWAIDTSGTATSTSSVTTVNYPTLTPLNSNELYAGYAYGGSTMNVSSPTSGFTYVATGNTKYLTYKTNASGGTAYTPVAQQSPGGVYASIAAVIEAYTGTSVIVNTTSVQDANFNVQAATAGTVAGILQAATSGTADVFQVKDSSGNNVMSVNSVSGTNFGLTLGAPNVSSGQLIFNSSGNANSITINAPSAPGSSYSLTLPTTTPAAGQCLATSPSNANQLVFSSCANQVTSVAITFVNNWKASVSTLSPSLSVSPANIGDLMTFFVWASKGNSVTTPPTGGGVSVWTRISSANSLEMWRGQVTSTGSSTISLGLSTPSGPTVELAAQEWTTGSTNGSWVIDTSGTISNSSSTTVTYPNLTPQSTKDLYIGYAIGGSTMSAGSTSGYSYLTGGGTSNMGAYNTSVSAGTQPTATQSGSNTSIAAAALIAAYSSSSVIANSTNTQQANFNIQAATPGSVAGTLQAFYTGTGDILDLLDGNGTLVGSVDYVGDQLVKPSTASAAAFQVQTTGSVNVLSVDTSTSQVVVGAGSTGEASPSLLVLDNETGTSADPSGVNGAMYYNATTHEFRCGVAGAWQNCSGLVYSNTSQSTSNGNCSNNCLALSTYATIPANYCQAGRVIKLSAAGYFSSQATSTNLQFGVYYGNDSSVASNDTLLGALSPSTAVSSASSNFFTLNSDIICYSTSAMQAEGTLNLQITTAGAGLTPLPMNSTAIGGTTVSTSSLAHLYIFPIWSAASASNTTRLTQLTVSSP